MTPSSATSITHQQLRVFSAVAREHSFRRAAVSLLMTEPAVSNHVRHLEHLVGATLFARSRGRRSIELTGAGQMLLETCDAIFLTLEHGLAAIQERHGQNATTIALGSGPNFGSIILPRLIESFKAANPSIDFVIEVGTSQQLRESLKRSRCHLAVIATPGDDVELVLEPFYSYDVQLIGPLGHRLADDGPHPLKALAQESYIEPEEPMARRFGIERMAAGAGVTLRVVMAGGDVHARMQAVMNGFGITPVDLSTALHNDSSIEHRRFSVLNVEGFPIRLERWIAYRRDGLLGAAADFRCHLHKHRAALEKLACVGI